MGTVVFGTVLQTLGLRFLVLGSGTSLYRIIGSTRKMWCTHGSDAESRWCLGSIVITVLLVRTLIGVCWRFVLGGASNLRNKRRPRASAPGFFIDLSHGQVHYEISTDRTSPRGELSDSRDLVVWVHGLTGEAFTLRREGPEYEFLGHKNGKATGMAKVMVDAGYDVLALDLYGHGWSDAPAACYSARLFVGQIAELLFALGISKPIILGGFSMGSFVATRFAATFPFRVSRLVLHSCWQHNFPFPVMPSFHAVPGLVQLVALLIQRVIDGNTLQLRTLQSILLHHHDDGTWVEATQRLAESWVKSKAGQRHVLMMYGTREGPMARTTQQVVQMVGTEVTKVEIAQGAQHGDWYESNDQATRDFFSHAVGAWLAL